jgi:putative MATE family efflux protein
VSVEVVRCSSHWIDAAPIISATAHRRSICYCALIKHCLDQLPDTLAPAPVKGQLLRDIGDALRGVHHDYTSGPIRRSVLLLAVPMVVEMSMESLFAVVDVFFVAKLGAAAVATIGVTESLMIVVYTLAFGLSIGATATVSRRIGEKDPEGAAHAAVQVLLLGAGISVVLGLLGAVFAPELLTLMGASEEVLAVGTGYARVTLGGSATAFLIFLVNAVFRGAGDAAVAMRVLILANGLNCLLDPALIFGWGPLPELGLTGAGVATTIGRGVGLGFALWLLTRGTGHLAVRRRHLAVEPRTMIAIARLSGWGTFQVALSSMSWIGLIRIVSTFGSAAMAGYTIAIRIILFALMPAFGLGAAAATMVGQSLGARDPARAERAVWVAARINVVVLGLVGLGFLVFAPTIVGWFTADEAVVPIAVRGLRWISLGFPAFAIGMVVEQSFNGAGDTRTPSWINFWMFWALQIPLALLLAQRFGLAEDGVFVAIPVTYTVFALVSVVLFRSGTWKAKVV